MNELIKKLQSDKAFAADFKAYLAGADSKVKEGTREVGKQLDKVIVDTIRGFAESKGMALSDDEPGASCTTIRAVSAVKSSIFLILIFPR